MDYAIPDEWSSLVDATREFCESSVDPIWKQIEREDEVPRAVLSSAAELGLFGLSIPEEFGGLGLSMLQKELVYEQLGRTHQGFASIVCTHCGIGTTAIVMLGNDSQQKRYLPRLASGEWIGAFGLTEPGAGSDASRISTRATRERDRWILNGSKHFITNSRIANVFTIFAVTDPTAGSKGISAFIVERDSPGFQVSRYQEMMGLRGSHVAELILADCEVPEENILGREGEGYSVALRTLAQGRVGLAARCVGSSARVTEMAASYSKQRSQFGHPISDFQLIQSYLAEMVTETEAARAMTRYAAWLIDQGKPARREAAIAKLFATEAYGRTVDKALQIHGGMGYTKEFEIEHFYRDARVTRIYEGSSEIQKLIIARDLLESVSG
jgi:acyl-CoA dehydrogenase